MSSNSRGRVASVHPRRVATAQDLEKALTRSRSTADPRYCRIPGACPPARINPSNAAGSSVSHASVARNSGAATSS